MFWIVPLSIIWSFSLYTQQWCASYSFADSLRAGSAWNQFHPDPASKLSANLYDVYLLLCVQRKTPDDGQRNCPKHVEFYSKNKFEKSSWFYYKNISRCTVTWTSNICNCWNGRYCSCLEFYFCLFFWGGGFTLSNVLDYGICYCLKIL